MFSISVIISILPQNYDCLKISLPYGNSEPPLLFIQLLVFLFSFEQTTPFPMILNLLIILSTYPKFMVLYFCAPLFVILKLHHKNLKKQLCKGNTHQIWVQMEKLKGEKKTCNLPGHTGRKKTENTQMYMLLPCHRWERKSTLQIICS